MYTVHEGKLTLRVFYASTGKNEELVIKNPETGADIRKEKMLRTFSGFSSRSTNTLKCGHCGRRVHIISQCRERRVNLSKSATVLTPRGETAMEVEEESTASAIRPEDSVSSVGLTAEALRSHNKRLRGHQWDPEEKREFAQSSRAALVLGPKPPDHPPPGFGSVSKAANVAKMNQKSRGTPAPQTGSAAKVPPCENTRAAWQLFFTART